MIELSTLVVVGIALGAAILGFTASRLISVQKEYTMANSADKLTSAFARVVALATTLQQDNTAKDATIADLKNQLAAVDPTAPADLAADEQAIAGVVTQADSIAPAPAA